MKPKTGDRIELKDGKIVTVTEVWEHENEHMRGFCIEYVTEIGHHYHKFVVEGEDYSQGLKARSGMPYHDRLKDFKWSYYGVKLDAVQKIVNSYIQNFKEWRQSGCGLYIFSGVNGSGKTYLACCIGCELIHQYNAQVGFVTVGDYMALLAEDKNKAQALRDSVVLIVDDIGSQNEKQDWIKDALFRLVDYRYREKLPTIFTSNMTVKEASKNDRTTSRIFEMAHDVKLPEFSVREMLARKKKELFLQSVL